ncbi:MBL fold metallo-hydrolase [Kribbella soli]|uniref:MBL fold metallo-hydrolase n=1 Tax=Kribbella soli TaxID=1124743 RepID=A0A4R0HJ52_9ACTN|nr:MBL fold metallo-hydrolase [Kribbella soli]TCC09824.1 MBL fold metallo-hydrolase [Kribbella soli]
MLQHLAGRVWIYPHDPDPDAIRPSVAVIADDRGSVLVDAGNSPEHARAVRTAIAAAGLPAPKWLVYTHHHWDHTWGACAWSDVTVIAHATAVELLTIEAARPWSHRYLHDQVEANPKLAPSFRARALAVPDWTDFRIVLPNQTFDDTLTLPTDVVLRHVGGNHAPDSVIVLADGVALLGDAFYPPPYHLRTPEDTIDYAMVKGLLSERHNWYVDAHSPPRRLSEALAQSG